MYKLSEAAASDVEAILTRSVLDFGVERTETYLQSLTHCLELLGDNPEIGNLSLKFVRNDGARQPLLACRSLFPAHSLPKTLADNVVYHCAKDSVLLM